MSKSPILKNLEDNDLIRKATQAGLSVDEYLKSQSPQVSAPSPAPLDFNDLFKQAITPKQDEMSPLQASMTARIPAMSSPQMMGSPDAKSLPIMPSRPKQQTPLVSIPELKAEPLVESPQAEQPKVTKESMYEMLKQKYFGGEYSDENRKKLQDEIQKDVSGPNWAAGLAALGAGIAGRDAMAAGQNILQRQDAQRKAKLEQFDQGRNKLLQDMDVNKKLDEYQRDEDILKREQDPQSDESRLAQQLAKDMGYQGDTSRLTAAQFKQFSPALSKRYEIEQRKLDRAESREERRFLQGIKMDEKVQALKTPYGLANTVDDAKQLKEAHEAKQNFDGKLQEMIDLRKKYGGEFLNREAVARGKQLSKDLLLEYKNMAKLGVLSKSDEDIINAIIPDDPLAFSPVPGQDPILSNLEKFKADSDRDFSTRVQTRTRQGIEDYNKPGKKDAAEEMITVSNGDETLQIPANDLADAEKDGFKRVK